VWRVSSLACGGFRIFILLRVGCCSAAWGSFPWMSVMLLGIIGELGQLFFNELGQARIFCCQLVCAASHFSGLMLGLLYRSPGLGLGIGDALICLVEFIAQCLLDLLGILQICDIGVGVFGQLLDLTL